MRYELPLTGPDRSRYLQPTRQSPSPRRLQKHAKSQCPLLFRRYLAPTTRSQLLSSPASNHGPPFRRACRAHHPGGSSGCAHRLLPTLMGVFPNWQEGRHSHCVFRGLVKLHSRYGPSDRSATQRRPLSRVFSPASYPAKALASFWPQSIIVQAGTLLQ